MELRDADLDDPRVAAMIAAHQAAANAVTPRGSCHSLDASGLREPGIRVWTIEDGPVLLAIGALKRLSATDGELKSMFTDPARRRTGAGAAMLRHILAVARAERFARIVLETGSFAYFAPARALYAKYGFRYCTPYGRYIPDPNSVFMSLDL